MILTREDRRSGKNPLGEKPAAVFFAASCPAQKFPLPLRGPGDSFVHGCAAGHDLLGGGLTVSLSGNSMDNRLDQEPCDIARGDLEDAAVDLVQLLQAGARISPVRQDLPEGSRKGQPLLRQ